MSKGEFKELLLKHELTVNSFLDLKDLWNRLSAKDKYDLLIEENSKPDAVREVLEGLK